MIVVTGATGKLGRHVVTELLRKMPAAEIVAAVRSPEKAADLAALGVQVRRAEYGEPETLRAAFAGAEKVLLISSNELGQRVAQHTAAITAAKEAGVKLFAYTSLLRADTSTLVLAPEHKATEAALMASGLPYVLLRNGWYLENHTESLGPAVQHGAVMGAAGNGRFASASRADYASAAVAVLMGSGYENKVFELAGDTSYTMSDLAAAVTKQVGKSVVFRNLPAKDYAALLESFGLPTEVARMLTDADLGAERGELDSGDATLRSMIGRPTTTLADAIRAALES